MIAEKICDLLPPELQKIAYTGELPTDVDQGLALVEFGGPHGTYFAGDQLDTPHLKIVVRDDIYPRGYKLIELCKQVLASYSDAEFSIILIGDILYLGRDDKRRNHFQITFKLYHK